MEFQRTSAHVAKAPGGGLWLHVEPPVQPAANRAAGPELAVVPVRGRPRREEEAMNTAVRQARHRIRVAVAAQIDPVSRAWMEEYLWGQYRQGQPLRLQNLKQLLEQLQSAKAL
jgi:hypothetical protein